MTVGDEIRFLCARDLERRTARGAGMVSMRATAIATFGASLCTAVTVNAEAASSRRG